MARKATAAIETHTVTIPETGTSHSLSYTGDRLTDEQAQLLTEFAVKYGRGWRQALEKLWFRAAAGPTLHSLRNTHGPSWLAKVLIT